MLLNSLFTFIFATLLTLTTLAYDPKEGNVSAAFGPTLYKPTFEAAGTNVPSASRTGFAVSVQGDLGPKSSLEISLFHLYKAYLVEKSNQFLEEETEIIQINIGYRRWLGQTFSAGLFFGSLYSLDEPKTIHSDFNLASAPPTTSANEATKYAAEVSLQTQIYERDNKFINLDFRYLHLLSPKADERGDHYGLFFSFNFLILEKNTKNN